MLAALAACASPSGPTSRDPATDSAYLKTAVADAEIVARRAAAFGRTNRKQRAAVEMGELDVILRRAREARSRIRQAHRARLAELAALRDRARSDEWDASSGEYDPRFFSDIDAEIAAATERVERTASLLATANLDVAKIERTLAGLRDSDVSSRI